MLEHHLVNDSATGAPETDAVFCGDTLQKVVHLFVGVDGNTHVDSRTYFGKDEVVAVHRGRNGGGGKASSHELQQGHLRGCILHCNAVWCEVGVAASAIHILCLRIAEVVDQNLFGQCQVSTKAFTPEGNICGEGAIHAIDEFDWGSCACDHDDS